MSSDPPAPTPATPRRRGRPKGTGTVDTDAIIRAALDALADGGWPALTMRGVARAVGIPLATLQHHHPTKDALWRAAVDQLTDDGMERRSQLDPGDLSGRLATFLEPGPGRPGVLATLLSDRAPGHEERLEYIAARYRAAIVAPSRRLRRWEEAGVVRTFDDRALIALVAIGIGAIAGAPDAVRMICGLDLSTEEGRAELADGLADVIGYGILAR